MVKQYQKECSDCGATFITVLESSSPRSQQCPSCNLLTKNMAESQYSKDLLKYLTTNLKTETIRMLRTSNRTTEYVIVSGAKKVNQLCVLKWKLENEDFMPARPKAIAQFGQIADRIRELIMEFVEKNELEAEIPTADIRGF